MSIPLGAYIGTVKKMLNDGGWFMKPTHYKWFRESDNVMGDEGQCLHFYTGLAGDIFTLKCDVIDESDILLIHTGVVRWSELGGRSLKSWGRAYVVDGFGIKAVVKIKYKGNLRDGSSPDKLEVEWKRTDATAQHEDYALAYDEAVKQKHIEKVKREDERYERAQRGDVLKEGRYELSGVVKRIRYKDTEWGISMKCVIQLDEYKAVYGTLSDDMYCALVGDGVEDDMIGKRITFTARVKQSDDDPLFGYYSRPSKVKAGDDNG